MGHSATSSHLLHGKVWPNKSAKREYRKYVQHGVAPLIVLLLYARLYPCHSGFYWSSVAQCILVSVISSKRSLMSSLRSHGASVFFFFFSFQHLNGEGNVCCSMAFFFSLLLLLAAAQPIDEGSKDICLPQFLTFKRGHCVPFSFSCIVAVSKKKNFA